MPVHRQALTFQIVVGQTPVVAGEVQIVDVVANRSEIFDDARPYPVARYEIRGSIKSLCCSYLDAGRVKTGYRIETEVLDPQVLRGQHVRNTISNARMPLSSAVTWEHTPFASRQHESSTFRPRVASGTRRGPSTKPPSRC